MQRAAEMRENAPLFAAPEIAIPSQAWQNVKPFVHGGLSGMAAWMFVQPADIVKVRIQLGIVKSPVEHHISLLRHIFLQGRAAQNLQVMCCKRRDLIFWHPLEDVMYQVLRCYVRGTKLTLSLKVFSQACIQIHLHLETNCPSSFNEINTVVFVAACSGQWHLPSGRGSGILSRSFCWPPQTSYLHNSQAGNLQHNITKLESQQPAPSPLAKGWSRSGCWRCGCCDWITCRSCTVSPVC